MCSRVLASPLTAISRSWSGRDPSVVLASDCVQLGRAGRPEPEPEQIAHPRHSPPRAKLDSRP